MDQIPDLDINPDPKWGLCAVAEALATAIIRLRDSSVSELLLLNLRAASACQGMRIPRESEERHDGN